MKRKGQPSAVTTTWVECNCHAHAIKFDRWDDGDLFFSIWEPQSSNKWGRWHFAWESLRGRWQTASEVILTPSCAEALRDALSDHLTKLEESQ